MRRTLFVLVAAVLTLTTAVVQATPASAASPQVTNAVSWLKTQQQADGGFEVAHFPGFETPDAVLAIASGAQSGGWDRSAALAAVQGATKNGNDALDALDDFAESGLSPAQAAKLIMLVVAPLGLNLNDFDPQNDSPAAVDLFGIMTSAAGNGSYASMGAAFNGRLYAALALHQIGQPVPAPLVSGIVSAQQANGSWSFDGSNTGSDFDADTTGLAIQALVAAGPGFSTAATVTKGVRALALNQQPSGAWQAFGSDDPNSTSLAILGITAAGGDITSSCWRNTVAPTLADEAYADPEGWLQRQQASDGHVASPNDGYGVNTFATSQSVEALSRGWLPIATAPTPLCATTGSAAATTNAKLYVDAAFKRILGRPADSAAAAAFAARIVGGATPSSVARQIMGTTEYRNLVVTRYFHDYLGTTPTAADLATYGAEIKAGHRTAVQVALLTSPAFTKAHSTSTGFVDALYQAVLGRNADTKARAAWAAALDGGTARATVAKAVVTSGEARSFLVRGLYDTYLGRAGDAGGVTFWRGKLGTGTSVETVIASMVGSSEFVTASRQS